MRATLILVSLALVACGKLPAEEKEIPYDPASALASPSGPQLQGRYRLRGTTCGAVFTGANNPEEYEWDGAGKMTKYLITTCGYASMEVYAATNTEGEISCIRTRTRADGCVDAWTDTNGSVYEISYQLAGTVLTMDQGACSAIYDRL